MAWFILIASGAFEAVWAAALDKSEDSPVCGRQSFLSSRVSSLWVAWPGP